MDTTPQDDRAEWTSRRRMETALSFQEADRVPIEILVPANLRDDPRASRLVELVDHHADNFTSIEAIDWGFHGVPGEKSSVDMGEHNGYKNERVRWHTNHGDFEATLERDLFNPGYMHWKKHFIETPEDLERLAACEFPALEVSRSHIDDLSVSCGERSTPVINLRHPFGALARMTPPEAFYAWLYLYPDVIHTLFRKQYDQLHALVETIRAPCMHGFAALEMAIEPWLGRAMFDEFIYPYDQALNDRIHRYGGRVRHHVHGPVFNHLEHWAEMGMDSIEPMEKPPAGNTDLAEAKHLMHGRMSLAGNLPSQFFIQMDLPEIERQTIETIEKAASGGGFILGCASRVGGLNSARTDEQLEYMIRAIECFIETGLKYGQYR